MSGRALKWTDVQDIAIELAEKFPDVDPLTVRFTDLHNWVMELDAFAVPARHQTNRGPISLTS